MKFNPANALTLIADEPRYARAIDIPRLREDCGSYWPEMAAWLLDHPDTPAKTKAAIQADAGAEAWS